MKIIIVLVLLLVTVLTGICSADKLMIPMGCYPREIQKQFLEHGYQLELDGTTREAESWGFIENEGSQYNIYTYNSLTKEELKDIMEIINGN